MVSASFHQSKRDHRLNENPSLLLKLVHRELRGQPVLLICEYAEQLGYWDDRRPERMDIVHSYLTAFKKFRVPLFFFGLTREPDALTRRFKQLFEHRIFVDFPSVADREKVIRELVNSEAFSGGFDVSGYQIHEIASSLTARYFVVDIESVFLILDEEMKICMSSAERWDLVSLPILPSL